MLGSEGNTVFIWRQTFSVPAQRLALVRVPNRGAGVKSIHLYRLRWYIGGMRVKTSVTLPEELLTRMDRVEKNRSALLEKAVLAYLDRLSRQERDRRDVEIINRNAERLNRDVEDAMEYQQIW